MNASNTRDCAKPSQKIVAEAAAWITRLHGPERSTETEAAFRSWLAADERHARAFEGMTEIWDAMPGIVAAELPRVTRWTPAVPARTRTRLAVAVCACALVCLIVYGFWRAPTYTTQVGEQRIVNLDDGSRVSLNSATRIAVRYEKTGRRITLSQGEAYFEVAHDAIRPFVVVAGDHQVKALGTAFSVRYEGSRTAVALVEGSVEVKSPGPAAARSVVLTAGERLTFASSVPQVDTPRMAEVTAWRRGEMILDETPLADAIAEMNRYDKTSLVIDDADIGPLPVSGIYRTGDSPGFARIVARMYGLEVVEEDDRIHLRR